MRKIFVMIVLGAVIAAADPFNTIPAWTVDPGTGYVGPYVPASISLAEDGVFSINPLVYAGYCILPRFDVTFYAGASIDKGVFSLGQLMIEPRWLALANDKFLLSPVFAVFVPLYRGGAVSLSPGVMATLFPLGSVNLHANLFYTIPLNGSRGEIALLAAPDWWVRENVSLFVEVNAYYSLDERSATVEFWPGACWYPTDWLCFCVSCGVPTTLDYVSSGLAAYVSF